jgi:hypothetical protein
MFQLIFKIKENDAYPIVIYPHQPRALKENEVLIFEVADAQEFEKVFKNICRDFVRLHGGIIEYIDK